MGRSDHFSLQLSSSSEQNLVAPLQLRSNFLNLAPAPLQAPILCKIFAPTPLQLYFYPAPAPLRLRSNVNRNKKKIFPPYV